MVIVLSSSLETTGTCCAPCPAESTKTIIGLSMPALYLKLQMPAQWWMCLTSPLTLLAFLIGDLSRLNQLYSELWSVPDEEQITSSQMNGSLVLYASA